jgi:3-methyladenine DNA glycosylase AlkD
MVNDLFLIFKEEFENHQNDVKAHQMSAYMRYKFEFYGIQTPIRIEITKRIFQDFRFNNFDECKAFVNLCFAQNEREWQYTGIWILIKNEKLWGDDFLKFAEQLVITNSWWDTVDLLASSCIGKYIFKNKHLQEKWVNQWMKSDNMWLNRVAIIHQLSYKEQTNIDLLKNVILRFNDSDEFFIQKAIGWALRQLSKSQAAVVKEIIISIPLKTLSKREGIKYLDFN